LIVGFDPNDTIPRLYQTEPSGIFSAWKVCHIFFLSKSCHDQDEGRKGKGRKEEGTRNKKERKS
jgi:hypothetical protein